MKVLRIVVVLVLVLLLAWWAPREHDRDPARTPTADSSKVGTDAAQLPDFLPAEAHITLSLIAAGGPFPHRQDGGVFGNREQRLPQRARSWYREYTVRTPGERTRGARRIVTGGQPPTEFWYTDDHYRTFRRFEVTR